MVLIWRDSGKYIDAVVTNFQTLDGLGFEPNRCVPIPSNLPQISLNIETGGMPNDFFYSFNMFIVSETLKQLLSGFPIKVEFRELYVTQKGKPYHGHKFFYANVLDEVCCFDYENSKYEATEKGIKGIERLVLDESKCQGHHFFRVGPIPRKTNRSPKSIRGVIWCVSEELATKIHNSGITDVTFVRPEDARKHPAENVAWKPDGQKSS